MSLVVALVLPWVRATARVSAACAIVGAVALLLPGRVLAQSAPELRVGASAEQVETEEPFTVELKAMVSGGLSTPRDPELHPPREFSVAGPNVSTQMMMNSFGAGPTSIKSGIGATWQLIAHKPGKYLIPGPTVMWEGHRVAGPPVHIVVVKASGRPRAQPPGGFLFPGGPGFGFPPWFGRPPADDEDEDDSHTSSELSLPQAPDATVFLHSTVDKKMAVIGEQVTLTYYIYVRPNADTRQPSWHDAPLSDFLRLPLLKNPGAEQPVRVTVGGKRWRAKLLDRLAIFPVRAGDLHTGSLRIAFGRAERASEDYVIRVTEPPLKGRPAGYAMGDVGRYALTAEIKSRKVDQGGSIPVVITLSGTGNLPHALRVPERTGVEWLEPELHESVEPQGGAIAGTRTFAYLVRLKDSGRVDLGEVTLPYWDPGAKQYQIARALLGAVDVAAVTPALAPQAASDTPTPPVDPFAAMPVARPELAAFSPDRSGALPGGLLWLCVLAPPLLVGTAGLAARTRRGLRARWAAAREAPGKAAQRELVDAVQYAAKDDLQAVAAASERAVHFAIEAAAGIRSRGVLLTALAAELDSHGVSRATADRVVEFLGDCDAIRFAPEAAVGDASRLLDRARALVANLEEEAA